MSFLAGYYFGKSGHNFDDIDPIGGALAVIGAIAIIGGGLYLSTKDKEKTNETTPVTVEQICTFAPGEHIVAMPIDDPTKEVKTYEGHIGYKPVGISTTAYGQTDYKYDRGYILYENVVDVNAQATGIDKDGHLVYTTFGTPVEVQYNIKGQNEYNAYEHIVSVPYSGFNTSDIQIEYHDGYEVAGIGTSSYGKNYNHDGGGCILYVNTEPVEYVYDEETQTYFGTPIEKQKVLEK